MTGSTVVFLGRVLVDSGEGWGTGPARVLIEESLLNVPKDLREVEIDTSAGTSCYYRLKAGERYVVFAARRDGLPVRLRIGGCSNTFPLQGHEHILDALRSKAQGGPSRLVGAVLRSSGAYTHEDGVPGALVVAISPTARYQVLADASGGYEIRDIAPGRYEIEVSKSGFVPDAEYNSRWSGRFELNKATNTWEPDKSEPAGSVLVGERSCQVWDLGMWPRGRISGTVRSNTGSPLGGVTVQAFALDRRGEQESRPLRTGTTDGAGKYLIEPLPGGEYVVGVNAERYRDMEPYPPTVFAGDSRRSTTTHISVTDGQETADIGLTLPAKRTATTLRVTVLAPGGAPYAGAVVSLENLVGVQRWCSKDGTSLEGAAEVPVYVGEQYVVKAWASSSVGGGSGREYFYLGGSSRVDVAAEHPVAVVVLAPRRLRDKY